MAANFPGVRRLSHLQLDQMLDGTPVYRGTIVATTTKNNHDTGGTPFLHTSDALAGKAIVLQPDADCWVNFGTDNAVTAVAGQCVKLLADERVLVVLAPTYGWVACVSVTGTTNLAVLELI